MGSETILLSQRLRTANLAIVLGLSVALVANVIVIVVDTSRGRAMPALALGIVVAVFVLIAFFALISFRVDVRVLEGTKGRSLVILYGPGGLLRQRIDAREILSASCEQLSPFTSGGWGYRGSLRFMKRAALVTRGGDALALSLTGGRTFHVTVDDPDDVLRVLTAPSSPLAPPTSPGAP
jgi:hypothetical protein